MTTPIQAAIAQLTAPSSKQEVDAFEAWATANKYDMTTHPLHWLFLSERTSAARQGWKAALKLVADVLAALQAEPATSVALDGLHVSAKARLELAMSAAAQGSIDTPQFQRLAHDYRRNQTDADYLALVAHIDAHIAQIEANSDDIAAHLGAMTKTATKLRAHIAQRTASGDAPWTNWPDGTSVGGYYWTKADANVNTELVYVKNAKSGHKLEMWECPGIGRTYLNYISERRFKALAAPTPDAPAGEFPKLPKGPYADYGADDMRSYVLADRAAQGDHLKRMQGLLDAAYLLIESQGKRAARAAAAPAGHAEPVANRQMERYRTCLERLLNCHPEDRKHWKAAARDALQNPIAAPVAAEPAPAAPGQSGETVRIRLLCHGDSLTQRKKGGADE